MKGTRVVVYNSNVARNLPFPFPRYYPHHRSTTPPYFSNLPKRNDSDQTVFRSPSTAMPVWILTPVIPRVLCTYFSVIYLIHV